MLSRRSWLWAAMLALVLRGSSGQESKRNFDEVKRALGLSDGQVLKLRELGTRTTQRLRDQVLDDEQRTKLAAMRTALFNPGDVAKLAARLGLVHLKDWERRFGGTCLFYSIREFYYYTEGTDVPLSREQAARLEKLPLSRAVVMEILDAAEKRKLAVFERELQAASEAIELGLLDRQGEILCH